METVKINELTLCHKHSTGFVMSTLPDVCKSPTYPVPYTNIAYSRDLMDGTTTVFSHGGAMNGILGSRFFPSYADEPGAGGGVISGVFKHEATFLTFSFDVFMENKPVTRLTDKMLMNKGNTMSMGGYYTGPVKGAQAEILEKTCEFACECKAAGTFSQNCIDTKLQDWAKKNGRKITTGGAYGKDGTGKWGPLTDGNGNQKQGGPKGTRKPDYTDHDNNSFGENKLPKDRYRNTQNEEYDEIEKDTGQDRNDVNFKDCDCNPKKQEQTAPATAPAPSTSSSKVGAALVVIGIGILVIGAIVLAPETGGGSLLALGAL